MYNEESTSGRGEDCELSTGTNLRGRSERALVRNRQRTMQAISRVSLRGFIRQCLPVQSVQVLASNMRNAPTVAMSSTTRSMSTGSAAAFDELLNKQQATKARESALGAQASAAVAAGDRSSEEQVDGDSSSSSSDDEGGSSSDSDTDSDSDNESPLAKQSKSDEFARSYGTGRRKTGVARVWIKEGSGQIQVNDKPMHVYFSPIQRREITQAFEACGTAGMFDVWCTVSGGGISGQAGAVRLGIARALEQAHPGLRPMLSREGMLTRDSRRVERKKPGQKKARKQFQWVKR